MQCWLRDEEIKAPQKSEMKIIPPLRNSESKASGNKRSSKDPDDQIWDALISLKNELA